MAPYKAVGRIIILVRTIEFISLKFKYKKDNVEFSAINKPS